MHTDPLLLDFASAASRPDIAGGKAAGLGKLLRYGLPVADGFVVSTAAHALGEPALPPPSADEAALARHRQHIQASPLPAVLAAALEEELERRGWENQPLAVRSSAPQEDSGRASFAGIHHSALNVVGPAALAEAIGAVWASLWTPQAVAYRQRFGLDDGHPAMAVVVMPMVPAVAAGVAFSCDPASGREDQVVINAVAGLGEALVGGQLPGEAIVLEEDPITEEFALVRRQASRQDFALVPAAGSGTRREERSPTAAPVLSDAQALELAYLVRDAAFALDYSAPWFDLEWVWDGDRFHLVQARPVTARPWNTYPGLHGQNSLWSNGNTLEVVPLPMHATDWNVSRILVNQMLDIGYRTAGFPVLPGCQRARLFNGRLYLNVSFIQWEGHAGFGVAPAAMNQLLGGHHPEIRVSQPTWREKLRRAGYMLRYLARSPAMRKAGRRQADEAFAWCRGQRREDWAALSNDVLAARLTELHRRVRRQDGLYFLQGSAGGSLHMLLQLVERYLPGESHSLVAALMAGSQSSVTARQGYELMALARQAQAEAAVVRWLGQGAPYRLAALPADSAFRGGFEAFIEQYGHRGVHESYARSPRWREDPGYLIESLPGLAQVDGAALARRQQAAAAAAWARLQAAMPLGKRLWARQLLKAAGDETNDRELARSAFIAYNELGRLLLLEVGRRLQAMAMADRPEDAFHLLPWETMAAKDGRLPATAIRNRIADRAERFAYWEEHQAPGVIEEGAATAAPPATAADASRDGLAWQGVPVGTGSAVGIARLIDSPAQGIRLAPGEILVAPATDPAWTPLFLKAGGLVMETGGYLSHGAIVAREFGIPAVVNLPGIRQALEDGRPVRVDGSRGRVEFLA